MTGNSHPPLIVILGPTAVGKTGMAIQVAQAVGGEIIGADSRQVYQHMDIGTAKPTAEQRATVPHYLVDFIPPDEVLTLARYQRMAYHHIDAIHARGKVPLLVGGTGQYLTAVTEGWSIPEVPPNDAYRAELESFAERDENAKQVLYDRLQAVDPEAAQKIHPNNLRRVIRALEVFEETGERISDLQRKKPPPYTILELGLELERQSLYERADARVDQMMEAGFLGEVESLLRMGYGRALPSMSGLGYLQLASHLLDRQPIEQAIQDTKTATHDFIRRQMTWFRGHDRGVLWHNVEQISPNVLVDLCVDWLNEQDTPGCKL